MSRIFLISFLVVLASCGGNLSDKERKALHTEMDERAIKKVSEEEIFEKALEEGRSLIQAVTQDSVSEEQAASMCKCTLQWITEDNVTSLSGTTKELWDAYKFAVSNGNSLNDNVQKLDDDLLYSAPSMEGESLHGVWFITFKKKNIILSL